MYTISSPEAVLALMTKGCFTTRERRSYHEARLFATTPYDNLENALPCSACLPRLGVSKYAFRISLYSGQIPLSLSYAVNLLVDTLNSYSLA